MSLKSDGKTYGAVAVTIHWLSAILIVFALLTGFRTANTLDAALKTQLVGLHVPLAVAVIVLTIARILWWWFADRKPGPVDGTPNWQHYSAKAVHWLFYIVIAGMAASGVGMFVLSGAGPFVFGGAEGQLPDFREFRPRVPHGIGARAMVLLIFLHVGAALYHHFVRGDGLLRRMWFSRS